MATTKKTLKCSFDDHWNHYSIEEKSIKDLWPSLVPDEKLIEKIENDIVQNGMYFPIMVCNVSHKELLVYKESWGKKLNELPFFRNDRNPQSKYQWSIWGGSQRLEIAKRLGYTHIDCAILPSVFKALGHQNEMRRPYLKYYYEK